MTSIPPLPINAGYSIIGNSRGIFSGIANDAPAPDFQIHGQPWIALSPPHASRIRVFAGPPIGLRPESLYSRRTPRTGAPLFVPGVRQPVGIGWFCGAGFAGNTGGIVELNRWFYVEIHRFLGVAAN